MNNKRLISIASLINNVNKVIDIGCDHAYLSLYCLQNKKANFFYNIDINKEPLLSGFNNIKKNGFENKTEFILNNGLNKLELNADILVISGMGANSAIQIIKNSKVKYPKYIVQPNNNLYKMRKFLQKNNFSITNELLVYENNLYYEIIEFVASLETNIFDEFDLYIGKFLKSNKSNEMFEYINKRINKIKDVVNITQNLEIKKEFEILNNHLLNFKRS